MDDALTPEEQAELDQYDAEDAAANDLTPEEQAELDQYDTEDAAQPIAQAPRFLEEEGISELESTAAGWADLMSGGAADEAYGARKAVTETLFGDAKFEDIADTYRGNRDAAREWAGEREEANPKMYGAGQLMGAATTSMIPGVALAKGASLGAQSGRAALVGAIEAYGSTDKETALEQLPDVAMGAGVGAIAPGVAEAIPKALGGVASVNEYITNKFGKVAGSQAEKSVGLDKNPAIRKEIQRFLDKNPNLEKGDLGEMLIDEKIVKGGLGSWMIPGGKSPAASLKKIKAMKVQAGEDIAKEVALMNPISTGSSRFKLEQKIKNIKGDDTLVKPHHEGLKKAINLLKDLEGKQGKDLRITDLENLKGEFINWKYAIADRDKIKGIKPFQKAGKFDPKVDMDQAEQQSLLTEVDETISAISKQIDGIEGLAYRSAEDVHASKSRIGREIGKKFDKTGKENIEALKDEYAATAESLVDAATDKEKYLLLNKRFEIGRILEDAAENKAAEGASSIGQWRATQGLSRGSLLQTGVGVGQMLIKRYGNSFVSAGFSSAKSLANLPVKNLRALERAAESANPAAAIRTSHYLMMLQDEDYRKAYNKNQEKDSN
jgi:hypothetical protein